MGATAVTGAGKTERATVLTHYRCNQACGFCHVRKSTDDLASIQPAAVRARIARAIDAGAESIVLSGGEPTMRGDLADLAGYATSLGAKEVRVETNATLVDLCTARRLWDAGVRSALVHLTAWGAALDRVTRDPGGFERASSGIDALLAAGLSVALSVTVVRSTCGALAELPAQLTARFGDLRPRTMVVSVPVLSPDATELLDYPAAVLAISALDQSARLHGIEVRLSPEASPPPCVFPAPKRADHLFSLAPGRIVRAGYVKPEACRECFVADRCEGFAEAYLSRFGLPVLTAIREERARRRLTLIDSTARQIERELVTRSFRQRDNVEEEIVRVQFQCNQSCRFCFVSTHLPDPAESQVRDAIVAAAARGSRIILSGGEPTLHDQLARYLKLASELSPHPVEVQTNAVRLADPSLCDALVEAGMGRAFVSLHGSTAAISDAVTGAPGTFVRTLEGIDNLARHAIPVVLNFVMCQANRHDLAGWVHLAGARWPVATLTFSFVAPSSDLVPRDRETIPSYTEALPEIAKALVAAREVGVVLMGFESMCGLPLCLVPDGLTSWAALPPLPDGRDGGEFVRGEACDGCSLRTRCYGIRRGYAAIYGVGELRRVRALGRP